MFTSVLQAVWTVEYSINFWYVVKLCQFQKVIKDIFVHQDLLNISFCIFQCNEAKCAQLCFAISQSSVIRIKFYSLCSMIFQIFHCCFRLLFFLQDLSEVHVSTDIMIFQSFASVTILYVSCGILNTHIRLFLLFLQDVSEVQEHKHPDFQSFPLSLRDGKRWPQRPRRVCKFFTAVLFQVFSRVLLIFCLFCANFRHSFANFAKF